MGLTWPISLPLGPAVSLTLRNPVGVALIVISCEEEIGVVGSLVRSGSDIARSTERFRLRPFMTLERIERLRKFSLLIMNWCSPATKSGKAIGVRPESFPSTKTSAPEGEDVIRAPWPFSRLITSPEEISVLSAKSLMTIVRVPSFNFAYPSQRILAESVAISSFRVIR